MDNKDAVNVPIPPDAAWERRLRLWVDDPSKSRGGVSNENAVAEMADCRTMVVAVDMMAIICSIVCLLFGAKVSKLFLEELLPPFAARKLEAIDFDAT